MVNARLCENARLALYFKDFKAFYFKARDIQTLTHPDINNYYKNKLANTSGVTSRLS